MFLADFGRLKFLFGMKQKPVTKNFIGIKDSFRKIKCESIA
jgi:hypothetical protein